MLSLSWNCFPHVTHGVFFEMNVFASTPVDVEIIIVSDDPFGILTAFSNASSGRATSFCFRSISILFCSSMAWWKGLLYVRVRFGGKLIVSDGLIVIPMKNDGLEGIFFNLVASRSFEV